MSQRSQNTHLSLAVAAVVALAFLASVNLSNAGPITFSDIQQQRNPIGPISPPTLLPNEVRLTTLNYQAADDGVSLVDQDVVSYSASLEVEAAPGDVILGINFLQSLDFDFGAPTEASNFVRTNTQGLISFTEINGAPVDPADPANQRLLVLDETFRGSDLPGTGSVSRNLPLPAGVTAFEIEFDNTLTAFAVEDTAQIVARDFRITIATAAVPEPSTCLMLLAGTLGAAFRRPQVPPESNS